MATTKGPEESGSKEPVSTANLRAKVMSSLAWLSAAKALTQLVAWAVTFKVISILNPSDYGLLSLAMVSVGFLLVFNELGLGAAIIQKRDLTEEKIRQIFAIVVSVNFLLFGVSLALAPLIAWFYGDERLVDMIRVLALQFPLMSLSVVPSSLLARDLELKKSALIDLLGQVSASFFTLYLALNGYGVWSLVYGSLASMIVRIVGLNIVAPFLKIPVFRLKGMGDLFSFSLTVLGARILFSLFSQLDVMIAGKTMNRSALGVYSVAVQVASMPMFKLMSIVNQVAFPAYSIIQHDPKQITYYFLKSLRLITVLSVAVLWGISAVSPEIVDLVLSEKWADVQLPLQLVALVIPVRMLSQMTSSMLFGCGRPVVVMTNLLIIVLSMGVALTVGSQWGAEGMAIAWVLAFPVVTLVVVKRAVAHLPLDLRGVMVAIAHPFLVGAVMYLAVAAARPGFVGLGIGGLTLLVCLILVGASVYVLGLSIVAKSALFELTNLLGLNRLFLRIKTLLSNS